ncbi:MAG: hypothetical protein VR65_02465 [Desulfobulbaceae bacterium BRH_c16a]|nr:MAG: hypothetical protein VR65_02465 [Desulfobulbaceae bacterium BRH_c16a]
MQQYKEATINQNQTNLLFFLFSIWSFFVLCRPQDYLSFLILIRPTLTLGLLTLFVYFLNTNSTHKIFKSSQFKLYMLLIIIMIIGVPFSYYKSASLKDVFNYASVSIMFFLLFYQLANTIEKLRSLLFAYCCGAAIYAIYILKFGSFLEERISFGSMFDPNDIAFFIINFLTFNLIFINKENTGLKRIIGITNVILGLTVILKTGSRGGFVACIAVFAYLAFVKTRTVNMSFFKKAIIITIAFISLLPLTMNTERYKTILDVQSDYNVTDETGRIAIWKIGMRMMISNPFTGVGMNRFNEGVGRDREQRGLPSAKWQAPHNSMVQIGAETGVLGLLLFCLMSYKVFNITGQAIRKSRSEELIRISEMARAGFLGHLVCAMFLGQAYSVYWIFYIVLSAELHRMLQMEQV